MGPTSITQTVCPSALPASIPESGARYKQRSYHAHSLPLDVSACREQARHHCPAMYRDQANLRPAQRFGAARCPECSLVTTTNWWHANYCGKNCPGATAQVAGMHATSRVGHARLRPACRPCGMQLSYQPQTVLNALSQERDRRGRLCTFQNSSI